MNIQDARVLVTGGSKGIGRVTAQQLRRKGAQVAITARNEETLRRTAEQIDCLAIPADVAVPADVERSVQQTVDQFGGLDVLINNAGFGLFPTVNEMEWKHFEQVFSANVFGAAMMAKAASRHFMAQQKGHIINIGSTAALKGFAQGMVYASSKFALRGLTQSLQAELRPYNVRVMLINPSEVKTAFAAPDGKERPEEPNKLRSEEIAHTIVSALEMDDRGFINEAMVWATNPFEG
jgi:3-oxoacyl-[acyl-carrier protein] reductase